MCARVYQVYNLNWLQRRLVSRLYSASFSATIEEALDAFKQVSRTRRIDCVCKRNVHNTVDCARLEWSEIGRWVPRATSSSPRIAGQLSQRPLWVVVTRTVLNAEQVDSPLLGTSSTEHLNKTTSWYPSIFPHAPLHSCCTQGYKILSVMIALIFNSINIYSCD